VNVAFLIGKDCLGAYWLMASSQEIATFSCLVDQSLVPGGIPYHERSSVNLHL